MKYLKFFEDVNNSIDDENWRTEFLNKIGQNVVFVNSELTKPYKFQIDDIVYLGIFKYQITAIDLNDNNLTYRLCKMTDNTCGIWAREDELKFEYELDATKYNL